MSDTFNLADYSTKGSQSIEGKLASNYTNWLTGEVKDAAGWIAYNWWQSQGGHAEDIAQAQSIQAALEHGDFTLSDLFNVANGKAGANGDVDGSPQPELHVGGVTIDLTAYLGGQETTEWTTGNGKNVVYHDREYLTTFTSPEGTPPSWDDLTPPANQEPTATEINVQATETASTYDASHSITNQDLPADTDPLTVNLLDPAHVNDPDAGDVLTVSNVHIFDSGNNEINPEYITIDGNNLVIEQNSPLLNDLKDGEHLYLSATYSIDDGNGHTIGNKVNIDIVGTPDQYQASGSGSNFVTYTGQTSVTGNSGVLSVNTSTLPEDGFDFTYTGGSITATATGLNADTPPEKWTLADGNGDDWGSPAINLTTGNTTQTETLDVPGALADGKVDYNLSNSNSVDAGDSMTITLNYQYDYWHTA